MEYKMKHLILIITFLLAANIASAQREDVNYDEFKVPVFTPPDPLIFNNGTRVTTVKQWEKQRRAELLEIFASQMYGRTPSNKIKVTYETL